VKNLLARLNDVPDTLARSSRAGHLYAIKKRCKLYGRERSLVVYTNRERGVKEADARNEALALIGRELDGLSGKGKDWPEKLLHSKIKSILNRVLKTQEEVEPVRHRLEHRVRAYLFVCMLAYRLLSALQWKLKEASGKEDSWERADTLLQALARVERVDVTFGNEIKTLYLNVTKEITDVLKEIGLNDLLKEETRLVESLKM